MKVNCASLCFSFQWDETLENEKEDALLWAIHDAKAQHVMNISVVKLQPLPIGLKSAASTQLVYSSIY